MNNYKLITGKNISLLDIDETSFLMSKEELEEMNNKMVDILNNIAIDCSYRERLVYEDIFKKAYISSFIKCDPKYGNIRI